LAEETGQIREIGIWVLAEACRQANNWRCNIPRVPPLVVSVNLSARQLREPDLVENVSRVIRESGLPVELLKLEITESVAMTEGDSVMGKLNDLRALGLRLAVDDFGTGYSSMSYLSTLPVETLKIDRSFISRMLRSQDDYAIVEAIVSLAKMLHLSITSEGVELPEEAFALRQLGCDRAQGYYYARPLPADAITQMLRDGIVFTIPEPTSSVPAIDALSL
jgi:EAL domain-containing protein (putative c-di-GMP-specific phosphodiesterase class I)